MVGDFYSQVEKVGPPHHGFRQWLRQATSADLGWLHPHGIGPDC